MGISAEIWVTCDLCEFQKSFPGDGQFDPNDIPGFAYSPDGLLICLDCWGGRS
jgi:hypothetical protein